MYATITEIDCKSPADQGRVMDALAELHAEVKGMDGFESLYVVQTGAQTLTMFTVYSSEADLERLSGQVRTHLGQLIGPFVAGPPHRTAGEVVLPGQDTR